MLRGLRATSVDHSSRTFLVCPLFPQFSLASFWRQRRRHQVSFFLVEHGQLDCVFVSLAGEMTANRDSKNWLDILIAMTPFFSSSRSGKAHFRPRYKVHTPLIVAARNLRNNVVITWFSAAIAAILLPGQTREFITSFLFPQQSLAERKSGIALGKIALRDCLLSRIVEIGETKFYW